MIIPVIKSLGHLPSASFQKEEKNTSINDSEALMTADNKHQGLDLDKAGHLNICGFATL